jgi:hypothetical protein
MAFSAALQLLHWATCDQYLTLAVHKIEDVSFRLQSRRRVVAVYFYLSMSLSLVGVAGS